MHRTMLESLAHEDNCFLTLTYQDSFLPKLSDGRATLCPPHLRDFLKRLRKAFAPARLRYYAVGEYGGQTERPHYHLAVFGLPSCLRGSTLLNGSGRCCVQCDKIKALWGMGKVHLDQLNSVTAAYIAGYVVKKMGGGPVDLLKGRHKEFARMSLKPGIGVIALDDVAAVLQRYQLEFEGDVPAGLLHGGKQLPLGKYLRNVIRSKLGKAQETPAAVKEALREVVRDMREAAGYSISTPKFFPELGPRELRGSRGELRKAYVSKVATKIASIEARDKILNSRNKL